MQKHFWTIYLDDSAQYRSTDTAFAGPLKASRMMPRGHDVKLLRVVSRVPLYRSSLLNANEDFCMLIHDFRYLQIEHVMYMNRQGVLYGALLPRWDARKGVCCSGKL